MTRRQTRNQSSLPPRAQPAIERAFVEALAALAPKLDDENKNILRLIFTEFTPTLKIRAISSILASLFLNSISQNWNRPA